VVEEVWEELDKIRTFSDGIRNGSISGCTGKRLTNIISIGIGGSYLGIPFLYAIFLFQITML